jgi:hypothetical protein
LAEREVLKVGVCLLSTKPEWLFLSSRSFPLLGNNRIKEVDVQGCVTRETGKGAALGNGRDFGA